MFRKRQIIGTMYIMMTVIVAGIIAACTPRSVREAQGVVQQADSLWAEGKMYGIDAGDSVTLAQAYETLQEHSAFSRQLSEVCPFVHCTSLLRTYSHACYHYGRLLREREDPVKAMQVFLSAAHSRTHDFHILGRVYSNMGDICHLASAFSFAYDMYEQSANMYLHNGDSLLYYYGLNNMAYELAEQGKKDSAFAVLEQIDRKKIDSYAIMKIYETKAEACLYAHMYDSAICYTSPLLSYSFVEPEWLLIRAQAYSLNGENDSAVYYANRALAITNETYQQNNALYILTNNDTTKNSEAIREVAADRADVQKLIEIKRSKCAQAVQLLEQDIKRPLDLSWLYAIMATLIIIGTGIGIYVHIKRRRHALLSQTLEDLQCATSSVQEKHDELAERYKKNHQLIEDEINNNCRLLQKDEHLSATLKWSDFKEMCRQTDKLFYMFASKLQQKRVLNETEIRLCVLVLINLSRAEISKTLPYALNSIGKLKDHTAKLLGTTGKNLHDFLLKMSIEE